MGKQSIIILLVGLNLFMLACLLLTSYSPPMAVAQEAAQIGNRYILVAAEAETFNDAIYILDTQTDRLHVFRTNHPYLPGQKVFVKWLDSRDLRMDFR